MAAIELRREAALAAVDAEAEARAVEKEAAMGGGLQALMEKREEAVHREKVAEVERDFAAEAAGLAEAELEEAAARKLLEGAGLHRSDRLSRA